MSARPIVIVGTGGSARETLMLLRDVERHRSNTWDFRGLVAHGAPDAELLRRIGAPFLGTPEGLTADVAEAAGWSFSIGIGSPTARRAMHDAMSAQGLQPATLIHPTAVIGDDVDLGAGAVVCSNCVITTNVRIGTQAQLNIGTVIGHDARIGDYFTTAQSVNLAGNVTIGDDVTLHTQAIVDRGRRIGSGAIVGSGAVVTRDVEEGATALGVPARSARGTPA